MNLLKEGIEKGIVIKTDRATKLTFDGITERYPIYQIRLDALFYNDQNDRIATWISRYKSENNIEAINHDDTEAYNDIIEKFIVDSNPEKLNATQKNIKALDQQKYGIVLKDGRIIDGNRRYTCLRRLAKENPKFNHFEAIILDKDIEHSAKQIKMLELQVQIGEEARVDYDPIDRLVGVYNDVVKNNLLTIQEYANSTNMDKKDVEKLIELSILLVEFLEAINAPEKFYIARDLNLNGPLHELQAILKKIKDEDRKEEVKYAVFTNFLMQPEGDMTRFIRQLKTVAKSEKYLEEFVEKESVITERVLDSLPVEREVTKEDIKAVRKDDTTRDELKNVMEIVTNKVKVTETRNKPLQILEKVLDSLEAIDTNIFMKLNESQMMDIMEKLDEIDQRVCEIREEIDVR